MNVCVFCLVLPLLTILTFPQSATMLRSGTVNSKSFVGKVLLQIKQKFELTYAL